MKRLQVAMLQQREHDRRQDEMLEAVAEIEQSSLSHIPADGKREMVAERSVMPATANASCNISANQKTGIDWPKNANVVIA